jgi:hypothetical protein
MILYQDGRKNFTPRRKVAKVRRKSEAADAKNHKPPKVFPLRLCFFAARPWEERKDLKSELLSLSSESLNPWRLGGFA